MEPLHVADPDARPPRAEAKYPAAEIYFLEPAAAIAARAQRDPRSLTAMTTHGCSGIGRLVLGSVAEKVIPH